MSYSLGQRASYAKTITEYDIYAFAGISGDNNPAHINEEYAKTTRFGRRIAHGLISAGLISAVLGTQLPGPGTILVKFTLKFTAPVFINDTVTAAVEIININLTRPDKPILTFKTECTNQHGQIVLTGEALVLAP